MYQYGDEKIINGKVAILAGRGGNYLEYLKDIFEEGIKTIVTGISVRNSFSEKTHKHEEKNKINLLEDTHYSTEKFVCIKICNYFKGLVLAAKFLEDKPLFLNM